MNLIDQLTQMQESGKSVVSIAFILNRLEESQSYFYDRGGRLPINQAYDDKRMIARIVKGGD